MVRNTIVVVVIVVIVVVFLLFQNLGQQGNVTTVIPTPTAEIPLPSPTQTSEVDIKNMAFAPSTMTVKIGTTITWTNNDSVPHSVTSDTGMFDSNTLQSGGKFSFTFNQAGTFPYHCNIHTFMKGTVAVTQ